MICNNFSVSNWGDSKEDWNEDIDSWTGGVSGAHSSFNEIKFNTTYIN